MSKIINIKPTINPDGYFQDNIDISVSQNKNLLKKISEIKAINIFSNLDNEILQIIVNNHKKLFDNKPLLENEFMVNAMEINELKSIEEKNFSRYLLYRYKYRFYAKKKN